MSVIKIAQLVGFYENNIPHCLSQQFFYVIQVNLPMA